MQQLSLAIPSSVGAVSFSKSWGICVHTVRYICRMS